MDGPKYARQLPLHCSTTAHPCDYRAISALSTLVADKEIVTFASPASSTHQIWLRPPHMKIGKIFLPERRRNNGKKLWENFKTHPAKEDPKSCFVYKLLNKEGKPVPPPKATQPGVDTRLDPYERRELDYSIPARNVAMVRAELFYNLLWPSLKKKFDFLPKHLKESTLMAFSEHHF